MGTSRKRTRFTGKQDRFVEEMILDPTNQTEAAERAGYSPASARIQASKNMKNPNILSAIKQGIAKKNRSSVLDEEYMRGKLLETLESEPGEGGIPWREWVVALGYGLRVTGLIQPGERSTTINALSISPLSGLSTEELRQIVEGGRADLPVPVLPEKVAENG